MLLLARSGSKLVDILAFKAIFNEAILLAAGEDLLLLEVLEVLDVLALELSDLLEGDWEPARSQLIFLLLYVRC